MRALLLALVLLLPGALPPASAASSASCQIIPHGALMGVDDCAVSGHATQSVLAVVSVTQGTVDAILIEMFDPSGARHVFVCTYEVAVSSCLFPVQVTNVRDGTWTVRATVVAADPLGPVLFGGADTHARLDASFT